MPDSTLMMGRIVRPWHAPCQEPARREAAGGWPAGKRKKRKQRPHRQELRGRRCFLPNSPRRAPSPRNCIKRFPALVALCLLLTLCLRVCESRGNLLAVVWHIVSVYAHRLAGSAWMPTWAGVCPRCLKLSNARSDRASLDGAAGQSTVVRTIPPPTSISVSCPFRVFFALGGT